ncbi:MAG TPA: BNR-4 repeat-containing protein, partial [bacterium]|nr:BNR-4 repeat-containing protein [bacterium]
MVFFGIVAFLALSGNFVNTSSHPIEISMTLIDDHAIGYATFQSHNQKVVSNQHGIFLTYLKTRTDAYDSQLWRLMRSTDGGTTFSLVYEATAATHPPAIETDGDGNIYLMHGNISNGQGRLYRFLAKEDFKIPNYTVIPNSWADKFSTFLDMERKQIYFAQVSHSDDETFYAIGLDGAVNFTQRLTVHGPHAYFLYPHLAMSEEGILHLAYTTFKNGNGYMYWDIHHILSDDAGQTWKTLAGANVTIPFIPDDTGPIPRITKDNEFDVQTWLSNMAVKKGKVHFLYEAQFNPCQQNYVRYDIESATEDIRVTPVFKGESIRLGHLDGFFAHDAHSPDGPLFCIARYIPQDVRRIGCLVSRDNGVTWHDHALSAPVVNPYSIGGCRQLTSDGYVIGS